MIFATLSLSGKDWLGLVAVLLLVALVVLGWSYRQVSSRQQLKNVCFALKVLGVLALLFILLEPVWNQERAETQANYFAIVADNSQGMQIVDNGESSSRGEELKELLTSDEQEWQQAIAQVFRVRPYKVDSRMTPIEDFGELNFQGNSSQLVGGIKSIGERYKNRPLAGILLFTDVNATDIQSDLSELGDVPPVYPVVMGSSDPVQDIAIQKVSVTETSFEDAPISVQADVVANGFVGERVALEVLDPDGNRIESQEASIISDGAPIPFRFQIKPEKIGVSFYTIRVAAKAENAVLSAVPDEATLANNQRSIMVKRRSAPYRVLYVSGRPNWEYKYLNRALSEDDQVRLVSLIRIADREPKFSFTGRRGESVNPIYRGFENETEDTEQYDEAVLKRLNVADEFELKGGFPSLPEDLFNYHAIILAKIEAEFFTRDQMALLQKFVSERGGGVMMMGGMESFREGNYYRTPIGDMLPVYLDREPEYRLNGFMSLLLSREGWLQPWARLRDTETSEDIRLETTEPFRVLNKVRGIKPGASVIAEVEDSLGSKFPALVTQRFGDGRTAALLVGDQWRWGMQGEEQMQDLQKSWRQMVRWLVNDVPDRVNLQVKTDDSEDSSVVKLQIRVRDADFKALDNATVRIHVESTNPEELLQGRSVQLTAEPSTEEAGLYETQFVSNDSTGYHVEVVAEDERGEEIGRDESGWFSDPAAEEFRSLTPNYAFADSLARATGGEVVALENLESFAKQLPTRKMPVMEIHSSPLWNTPFLFLLALLCFLGEWGLRRWKGMP